MARDIFMRFEIITANVQQMFPQPRNECLYLENFLDWQLFFGSLSL